MRSRIPARPAWSLGQNGRMVTTPLFRVKVPRLCRVRTGTESDDTPFPLDLDGFLDPSAAIASTADTVTAGTLVTPATAATAGALVLLGEPGVGKTTVFGDLTEGLPGLDDASQAEHTLLWLDAARLTEWSFQELLGRHLRALPEAPRRAGATAVAPRGPIVGRPSPDDRGVTLTIVLDQVDESPMLPWLADELATAMKGRDTSRLRVLLACRTADYPSALTDVLARAVGGCVLADLAPLRREEAVTLAASADVDGEAVVAAAVAAGAGALASVPLTLELLVRVFHEAGVLEGSPADLFAKGVRLLADEHDDRRRAADTIASLDQRMAIAGRIAVRLLLAGRRTVWRGPDLDAGPLDVRAGSLPSGTEQTVSGPFDVTPAMVSATLGTALFTGRGEHRLAFRHSSLAAYLAVCHLREHQVPHPQLATLFLVAGDDATTSIPVPLRETAAWLLALDPAHSDWLATADPESLAAHSAVVDSAAMKALVVHGLLDRAPQIELGDPSWRRARWQVAYPGLADQLAAVLAAVPGGEPQDWPTQARVRLAVRLAREAAASDLAEPLLALAEHDRWSPYTRQLAARTAFETAPEVAVPRLRALLDRLADEAYAAAADPDDELRGALLEMLWPDHLALEEALVQLRPRRHRWLFGLYARFLRTMPDRVGEADIPKLLAWTQARMEATPAAPDADKEYATVVEEPTAEGRQPLVDPSAEDIDPSDMPIGQLDKELLEGIVDRALSGESAVALIDGVAALLWPRLRRFEPVALPAPLDVVDADGVEPERARELRRTLARALVALTLATQNADQGEYRHVVAGWHRRRVGWRQRTPADEAAGLHPAGRRWLLDAGDFGWALQTASEAQAAGNFEMAQALGALASMIFDWRDSASFELAYEQRDSPVSEHLRWIWEAVRLDSERAHMLRQSFLATRDTESEPWPELERFTARLREQLAAVVAGDTAAFWQLLWGLQFDPQTGHAQVPRLDGDVLSFPGMTVLGEQAENALRKAGLRYLTAEHDHAVSWLGTNHYDKRAWAGYLALVALDTAGRLDDVPSDVWASWAGALVWFPAVPVNAGDPDRKRRMLSLAARHAPGALATAVARLVRGNLAQGHSPLELELIDPGWAPELADVLFELWGEVATALLHVPALTDPAEGQEEASTAGTADQPSATESTSVPDVVTLPATTEAQAAAFDTWETLLRLLLSADKDRAIATARDALGAAADGERHRRLAVLAARTLLQVDTPAFWLKVKAAIGRDPDFSRELALVCAGDQTNSLDLHSLDEAGLAEVYRWLADLFQPADDVIPEGVHVVSPEEAARHWRDTVLRELAQRATRAAVFELARLAADFPDRLDIAASLRVARGGVQANAWSPPSPEQVAQLLSDVLRRLVRSTAELATLLLDTLAAIAADLPAHGELLWDRQPATRKRTGSRARPPSATTPANGEYPKDTWRPKPEAALSAYLAHELTLRLTGRGVAVNREVLIQPRNPYGAGDRTDIAVEATLIHDPYAATPAAASGRLVVVVEVKGAWNDELLSAQREQLAVRYLPESSSDTGVYVVGWYPVDLWTAARDPRKAKARRCVRDDVERTLVEQADDIASELKRRTRPFLLEIPRPHPASEL
jgi:hypothetical protein